MPTRHRPPMRTLVAMLLALALLLMLGVVCVDAAETIAVSKHITLVSQTLDGTVLDATAAATATATVNVLLQRSTVQGGGLTVDCATTSDAAGSTAIALVILDTSVKNAALAFRGYMPEESNVRIVNVTATNEDNTPLFDLQHFYLNSGTGSSMTIQRVRAMWVSGTSGSLVQVGGSDAFLTLSGHVFSVSDAVVTGAAHILEITSQCTGAVGYGTNGGLNAFDMIEVRDACGSPLYSNTAKTAFSSYNNGMIRFSNITATGGMSFLELWTSSSKAVDNRLDGTVVFSSISNDGPLFRVQKYAYFTASTTNVKYAFRHINVASVISAMSSYAGNVPKGYSSDPTWYFYMGNITVAGTLLDTIEELENNRLYASQLVGAYGEVIEVRSGNWPTADTASAAAVYCVTGLAENAAFVDLAGGVQRAECKCASGSHTPYCTSALDPLAYYDAYSPSSATCDADNCDTCVFGQTSQCAACAFGYMLTASLGCDKLPCDVEKCNLCATDNVCSSCAAGYVLTTANTCVQCAVSHCNQCVSPGDGTQCDSCAAGYTLSDDKSTCFSCNIPGCNGCTADNVCGSCSSGHMLSADNTACYACDSTRCGACSADNVCASCLTGYALASDGASCVLCDVDDCTVCSSDHTCASCAAGYTLSDDQSTCIPCEISNCNGCTADNVCGSCAAGYTLSDDKKTCIPCGISNCAGCTADSVCGACAESYVLTSTSTCAKCTVSHCNQCVSPGDGTQCDSCAAGYTLSDDKNTCFSCNIPGCNGCTADNVCGSCSSGHMLSADNTACYACDSTRCGACSADNVCASCLTGYALASDGASCVLCDVDDCTVCSSDHTCASCETGYSLSPDNTTCYACDILNCAGCTADGVCGSCDDSYTLTSTISCTKCAVLHCSQCTPSGDGTQCATCADGFKLNAKGVCKQKTEGWWVWFIVGLAAAVVVAAVIVLGVYCGLRHGKVRSLPTSDTEPASAA